jgi:hypothetical protein
MSLPIIYVFPVVLGIGLNFAIDYRFESVNPNRSTNRLQNWFESVCRESSMTPHLAVPSCCCWFVTKRQFLWMSALARYCISCKWWSSAGQCVFGTNVAPEICCISLQKYIKRYVPLVCRWSIMEVYKRWSESASSNKLLIDYYRSLSHLYLYTHIINLKADD